MTHSLPNRNSISPSRKNINNTMPTKSHQALKIITTASDEIVSSPTSVRQRLSSLFRTSSPVVLSLKETFHTKRASLSTVSFFPPTAAVTEESPLQEAMGPLDDSLSTSSSASSVHMPSSPVDTSRDISTVWQPSVTVLSYEEVAGKLPPTPPAHFAVTRSSSSLAFQVNQILGSTLEEVDEEIDQDWEISRNLLHQSLVLSVKL